VDSSKPAEPTKAQYDSPKYSHSQQQGITRPSTIRHASLLQTLSKHIENFEMNFMKIKGEEKQKEILTMRFRNLSKKATNPVHTKIKTLLFLQRDYVLFLSHQNVKASNAAYTKILHYYLYKSYS